MGEIASAYISLIPSAKGFGPAVDRQIGGQLDKSGRLGGSRLAAGMRTAAVAGLATGGAALGAALFSGIKSAAGLQQITTQTAAALKSTGGAAGVTAKQVRDLANEINNYSTLDDDAVQSGENMLLTFTNIRNEAGKNNDIFTQTTKIMADMSVALGQDTKSSALQLGKALNDPIRGVTALQRVGVSFTEQQRNQIKALVDSGRTMQAQKLILGELNKEFGGSAKKAGSTFAGAMFHLKDALSDTLRDALIPLLPGLTKLAKWAGKVLPGAMQSAIGWIKHIIASFSGGSGGLGGAIGNVRSRFGPLVGAVKAFVVAAVAAGKKAGPALLSIAKALAPVAVRAVVVAFRALGPVLKTAAGALSALGSLAKNHTTTFKVIAATIASLFIPSLIAMGVRATISAAQTVAAWVASKAAALASATAQVGAITKIVAGWVLMGAQSLLAAGKLAAAWLIALGPVGLIIAAVAAVAAGLVIAYKKSETFRHIVAAVFNGIKTVAAGMWNAIKGGAKLVADFFTGPFLRAVGTMVSGFVKGLQFLANAALAAFGVIVHGGATMLGWVPGIGGKLKDAAKAFDIFKGDVNSTLNSIAVSAGQAGTKAGTAFGNGFKGAAAKLVNDAFRNVQVGGFVDTGTGRHGPTTNGTSNVNGGGGGHRLLSNSITAIRLPKSPGFDGASAPSFREANLPPINVYNPVPEKATESIPRALREAAFLSGTAW